MADTARLAELEAQIALTRENLRDLTEQAAARSGAACPGEEQEPGYGQVHKTMGSATIGRLSHRRGHPYRREQAIYSGR